MPKVRWFGPTPLHVSVAAAIWVPMGAFLHWVGGWSFIGVVTAALWLRALCQAYLDARREADPDA